MGKATRVPSSMGSSYGTDYTDTGHVQSASYYSDSLSSTTKRSKTTPEASAPAPSMGSKVRRLAWQLYMLVVLLGVGYAALWLAFGDDVLPGAPAFALLVLFVLAALAGTMMPLMRLPPLLGMLVMGFVLRNVPGNVLAGFRDDWAGVLRAVALSVILVRAGLGLNIDALKRLGGPTLRLAFLPVLAEAVVAALVSRPTLGLPWEWCFLLGFVMAAVSPAVVVPSLLALQNSGYGTAKGIPSMILAAAGLDDVVSISGFGAMLSVVFATGSVVWSVFKGPVELVSGAAAGLVLAVLVFPFHRAPVAVQSLAVFLTAMASVLLGRALEFTGAGALAAMSFGFCLHQLWRRFLNAKQSSMVQLSGHLKLVWRVAEPVLFSLIGAAVVIDVVVPSDVGWGVLILAVALLVRLAVTYTTVLRSALNNKERWFVTMAWLPKATVQAALGSVALDVAREKGFAEDAPEIQYGRTLLTIAVLVILITAPIGAALIALLGPRLLSRSPGAVSPLEAPSTQSTASEQQHSTERTLA